MFSKEELMIIFDVFDNLELESKEGNRLVKKMALLKQQAIIGDKANEEISKLQEEINALYKDDENED